MTSTIELNETRKKLYRVSDDTLLLVNKVRETLTHLFPKVEVNGIRIDSNQLKINDLYVQMIETDPQVLGCILIHWYPNYKISTQSDPYCSIYMLTEKEIKNIWRYLKKVQAFSMKHNEHPQ
jgi:hypothetical protein